MNFLHPDRLWALVVVAGLAAAYVTVQVRRRRAIARYTNPELLDRLAPRRAGRLRHLSPLMSLLALAALAVAVAQPTRAEAVPRDEGVVVLAVDVSASMAATDVAPTRLAAAIAGATDFVDGLPDGLHVGLVAFDGTSKLLVAPTTDHEAVTASVARLEIGPGTATGDGLSTSLDAAQSVLSPELLASGDDLPVSVVLLADGATTVGRPLEGAVAEAEQLGVPVTTIAFGTPDGTVSLQGETVRVPADTETMKAVAAQTGGTAFQATTAGELKDVYADITSVVGTTTEHREVTRGVIGAALAVLVASVVVSAWTGARAL
jgi:Ca-activated chloride channel family protein